MYTLTRKILGGIILLLTCSSSLFSQQLALNSGYIYDHFQINPAYAGFKENIQLTSLFSKQFTGISRSPQTAYFGANFATPNQKVGLGLQIMDDRQFYSKTAGAQIAYSYKIKTGDNSTLSGGLQAGLFDYRADYSMIDVVDANDPYFTQSISKVKLNFGVGFYFNTPKFFIGLSSPSFKQNNLNDPRTAQESDIKQNRQLYFNAGYVVAITDDLLLKPSGLMRIIEGSPISYDINATLSSGDNISLGVSYRDKSALVGMLDLKVLPALHVGYMYGYNTTGFNTIITGSHEFMLRYEIPAKTRP